jgi:hypothetical protein
MSTLSSQDLIYTYSWNAIAPDNPHFTGSPDSDLLNRREGYEVIKFINHFSATHKIAERSLTKADALKVERMIHTALPGTVRSHTKVTEWIRSHWSQH